MRQAKLLLSILSISALISLANSGEALSYGDLVSRLVSLESLAVPPSPGEGFKLFSSYDRSSRYDEASGKYVNWLANNDGSGLLRKEGDQAVLAEMEGPGVIWRIWSAQPESGHLKIYIDGEPKPAVDMPFKDYFSGPAPFNCKALCHVAAKGFNCHVPIPFKKSCKVVAEKGWGSFYQIGCSSLPKDVEIESFKLPLPQKDLEALAKANSFLAERLGEDPAGRREGEESVLSELALKPGASAQAAVLRGPRAVTGLFIKLSPMPGKDDLDTLRELCLRISWDEESSPSVWAPLGDFFGSAPGVNFYRSLPLGVTDEGFYCLWYMPFARSAKIELVNDGRLERKLSVRIVHSPLSKPAGELLRFHVKWHRDAFLPQEPERDGDWTMLKASGGPGRFAGVTLHVWNPDGGWWGEGDEKLFVDGERFPSSFGTGAEDYFGYAWCSSELFQNAYHNQVRCDKGPVSWSGHTGLNRWHVSDNVPFQRSFEASLEKYFSNKTGCRYAATAYWYQASGSQDPYGERPLAERVSFYPPPKGDDGRIPFKSLKVVGAPAHGKIKDDWLAGPGRVIDEKWCGSIQTLWSGGLPGDKLAFELPVRNDGRFKVLVQLTKGRGYGAAQLHLDSSPLGPELRMGSQTLEPSGFMELGTVELKKGAHRLEVELKGSDPSPFGLDSLKLEAIKENMK